MAGTTLPERVAQIYYTYGLFCSSYPVSAITIAVTVVLLCCCPLLNVPLPGNIPTVITLPVQKEAFVDDLKTTDCGPKCINAANDRLVNLLEVMNETQKLPYVWTKDKPLMYVQQIVLKTGVTPWTSNLHLWDAFRAPMQEVFRLLETIRNHEDPDTKMTLAQHCYHVESVKKKGNMKNKEDVLPEYSCLVLSPANLWQQNMQTFSLDSNIVGTVFNHQNLLKGKVSVAEMAFGMQLKDAGIKRYPLRTRPRALQYAVTIFYHQAGQGFIDSLMRKLSKTYPLYQDIPKSTSDEVTLIYYPGQFNFHELIPLSISFIGLFLYVYFSVRKIEFVKSKFGLASCAVTTIAGSLSMSMGLCFFFGFSLSLQGKEIFPYLVILVGLENVLVLTKSVTSTDSRLDVKIRLAQGLSKEGWSITKNLLIEITILTVSLFTFVPVIQEFSIFMIVSLISDFFIQMVFFATILGIDVRRMEYFQEQNNKLQLKEYYSSSNALNWRYDNSKYNYSEERNLTPQKMSKSKSHPRLNGLAKALPTDVVANRQNSPGKHDRKVPKRIRLVNMWARTRFFQRAFMVWMVVWISMIVYNSGIIDHFVEPNASETPESNPQYRRNGKDDARKEYVPDNNKPVHNFYNRAINEQTTEKFSPFFNVMGSSQMNLNTNETISLKHSHHLQPWKRLSKYHWSTILSQYNVSVSGKYIVLLPPQLLSCRISPDLAASLRNPDEKEPPPLRWQALAAALDPIDIIPDFELTESNSQQQQWGKAVTAPEIPIYPTTPMEILLLAILCTISVLVIAYTMVVLYRCVCTRNYAEWRTSWNDTDEYIRLNSRQLPAIQLVMEAVPLVVSGHGHEVECLVTDGEKIVSSCLQGTIKVWNSQNGEMLTKIDRYKYYEFRREMYDKLNLSKVAKTEELQKQQISEVGAKLPETTDVSNKQEDQHMLKEGLVNHLNTIKSKLTPTSDQRAAFHLPNLEKTKYGFAKTYRQLYGSKDPCDDSQLCNSNYLDLKENIDINNLTTNNNKCNHDSVSSTSNISDSSSAIDNSSIKKEVFVFNSNESEPNSKSNLRNRIKDKFVYSPDYSLVKSGEDSELNLCEQDACVNVENSDSGLQDQFHKGKLDLSSPIWCMDFSNDLIILGCADGRLEFWEASTAKLMCVWWGMEGEWGSRGVTHVHAFGGAPRVCIASLSGHLTLLRLDAYDLVSGAHVDWHFSTTSRRTHLRTGSAGSIQSFGNMYSEDTVGKQRRPHDRMSFSSGDGNSEEVRCVRIAFCRPHQQPITEMQSEGGRIVTGGQDHVLKVFNSMDLGPLFTLHGHCGPITSCFIDRVTPTIGGSGSQDGLLCVWDLHTGACLYSMQAHDGAVTSLAYTASYVISAGTDERLCVWDRFQGHMLNSVHIGLNYMSRMLPLTHSLLLMGDRSGLMVYDLSSGDVIRRVLLGQNDGCIFVRQILPLKDAIVCDYANQLRIVRFPLV